MIHMARVKKCYGVDIGGLRPPVALRRATATSVDAAQKGLSHDHLHAARRRLPSPQARAPGKLHPLDARQYKPPAGTGGSGGWPISARLESRSRARGGSLNAPN